MKILYYILITAITGVIHLAAWHFNWVFWLNVLQFIGSLFIVIAVSYFIKSYIEDESLMKGEN